MISKVLWRLRTDPFYPETAGDGSRFDREAIDRTLDPRKDPKVVPLFYNVYEWTFSRFLGPLQPPDGLVSYPSAKDLPAGAPLMVILSGSRSTGLDSLANLVIHTGEEQSQRQALICEVELQTRDQAQNAANVAARIPDVIEFETEIEGREAIAAKMRARLKTAREDQQGQASAGYSDVFKVYAALMRPLRLMFVVRLTKQAAQDSWASIYESLGTLVDLLIVTTSDAIHAKTCYDRLTSRGQNVVWIRALPLDRERARDFVRSRISAARLPDKEKPSEFHPFTAEAIDALFERGSNAKAGGGSIEYPVGWIRQTLYRALKERRAMLEQAHGAASAAELEALGAAAALVEADHVSTARNAMNRGLT
jgi:hypothetical protein